MSIPQNREEKILSHCWNCQHDDDGTCPVDTFAKGKLCHTRANYRSYRRRIMQEVGCNSHILNAEADGRDVAQKILDVLSDEWMATIDVIHWAGCSENYGRGVLIDLLKSGTV